MDNISLLPFFKLNFKQIHLEHFHMSNSLNQDQNPYFVGPDLGPNCLKILSADDKSLFSNSALYLSRPTLKRERSIILYVQVLDYQNLFTLFCLQKNQLSTFYPQPQCYFNNSAYGLYL